MKHDGKNKNKNLRQLLQSGHPLIRANFMPGQRNARRRAKSPGLVHGIGNADFLYKGRPPKAANDLYGAHHRFTPLQRLLRWVAGLLHI